MRALAAVCGVLTLALSFSGCAGTSEPKASSASSSGDAGSDPSNPSDPANPSVGSGPGEPTGGGTQTRVKVDPNATFEGGAHAHDQWAGRTEYTIMDRDFPGREGGICYSASILSHGPDCGGHARFDTVPDDGGDPNNVWPGTGLVTLTVEVKGEVVHPFEIGVSYPGSKAYQGFVFLVDESPVTFDMPVPAENMTDPPHFRTSQWAFNARNTVASAGYPASLWTGGMHWTVKIFRSDRPLPIDPPHPDYWAGAQAKVLFEGEGPLEMTSAAAVTMNGASFNFDFPDNSTVIPGTKKIVVTIKWTNEYPAPTKFGIHYCGANQACIYTGATYAQPEPTTETENERTFEFEVRPDEWDSPYSTKTQWRFKHYVDHGDLQEVLKSTVVFKGTFAAKIEAFRI